MKGNGEAMTERMTKDYQDIDGNPCSLDVLCRREPAWAANRIRVMTAELDAVRADLAELVAALPKCSKCAMSATGRSGSRFGCDACVKRLSGLAWTELPWASLLRRRESEGR